MPTFFDSFSLKMQRQWRIAPEKRWFCIEKWPFISLFKVSTEAVPPRFPGRSLTDCLHLCRVQDALGVPVVMFSGVTGCNGVNGTAYKGGGDCFTMAQLLVQ